MPKASLLPLPADAPTLDQVRDALYAEMLRADQRYKLVSLDMTRSPRDSYHARKRVERLHAALEVIQDYAYGWPEILGDFPLNDD